MSAGKIELSPPSRGYITQRFAQKQGQDGQPHAGQDWAYRNNETGEVFDGAYAMADGVVVWSDDTRKLGWPNPWYFNPDFNRNDSQDSSAGNAVVLKHWFGYTTYCHLEETPLNDGDKVKRGQRVGTVGATGFSAGKHLHSDLILNGADVSRAPLYGRSDPNPYLTSGLSYQSATITSVEDDEMTAEDIAYMKDKLARLEQLSLSFQAVLTDPVSGVIKQAAEITLKGGVGSRYVRSEVTGEDTVYERTDDGKLRPLTSLTEFQLAIKAGETYRLVPKWMIDGMPKTS